MVLYDQKKTVFRGWDNVHVPNLPYRLMPDMPVVG